MTYHWQDEHGAWQVGRHAEIKPLGVPRSTLNREMPPGTFLLIRHWPTGELEWVPESKLMPYPSEKIEEPTK